ncbi:MAG: hypothetical protein Q7Q71_11775 [Verrucomicrobiota bacterium JB023]|nr:hypothetical protein [Verrucomicrobiota bacterium JB023]
MTLAITFIFVGLAEGQGLIVKGDFGLTIDSTLKVEGVMEIAGETVVEVRSGAILSAERIIVREDSTLRCCGTLAVDDEVTNSGLILADCGSAEEWILMGNLLNTGLVRISQQTSFLISGLITNSGILDAITAGNLPGEVRNLSDGRVYDSDNPGRLEVLSVTQSAMELSMESLPAHVYTLQVSETDDLQNWVSTGEVKEGSGEALVFQILSEDREDETGAYRPEMFFRVMVTD